MWYARFVRTVRVIGSGLDDKHRELLYTLIGHNCGASVFPSLQRLSWSPSSYSDCSYFPLFSPQLHTADFKFPDVSKVNTHRPDTDTQSNTFLTQLHASSPRLSGLYVDASWQRIGEHHCRAIPSFKHLLNLNLIASVSATSLLYLATMPRLTSLQAGHVWSDELAPSLARPAQAWHAPCLTLITIRGDCHVLAHLFAALHAPLLKVVVFSATCRDPDAKTPGYVPCLKALATLGASLGTLRITLADADSGAIPPRTRTRLAALLNPLLRLRNVRCFTLSCPKLRLVADDDDFAALARAWPRLQTFRLTQAYWDASRAVDSDDDEDGYGYAAGDGDAAVEDPASGLGSRGQAELGEGALQGHVAR